VPGYPTSGDDIDIVLAALLKGLSGIDAKELDGPLKDLLMPEPGAKGEISVKEAAEVCFICYIVCEIWCYIACYLPYHITLVYMVLHSMLYNVSNKPVIYEII